MVRIKWNNLLKVPGRKSAAANNQKSSPSKFWIYWEIDYKIDSWKECSLHWWKKESLILYPDLEDLSLSGNVAKEIIM